MTISSISNRLYPVQSRTVPCTVDQISVWKPALIAIAIVGGFLTSASAQNGLRDIPSTKVEDQAEGFKLPEGAEINIFAAEPLLKKPVHMNWDTQGRLWVVSSPLYPHIEPGQEEIDQVIILEDTDGDGKADKSTVFADNLHIPTAVLPGDGGAYVANSTEMLFLKDTDGDGKADHRRVVLSGFGTEDTHHLLHTFRWGPEGMIWMNQSIYIHTHLETPYGIRRLMGGGMWYYRPETQRAEVFMKGLINPWGHAFDKYGQSFLTDGAGSHGINFVFPDSVFRTAPGATRVVDGLNPGQPKHCGAEVLSGKNVPEDYLGTIAAADFRGHRVNRFKLTENGTSGYTSTQVEDLVTCTHRAFRPIDVKMGPDGGVYIADWYNPIIQHGEVDFRDERRDHQHGRIWRVTFPDRPEEKKADIPKLSEKELANLAGPVGWNSQMATVELRNRNQVTALDGIKAAWEEADEQRKLYLVMSTQAINRFQSDWAVDLAKNAKSPQIRAGAIRAIYYHASSITESREIAEQAVADTHPRVRLWGVSLLTKLAYPDTVQIALRALDGIENPDDFLDFAVWNICREHSYKWTGVAETRNPFQTPGQLLYAMRAVNTNVGSQILFDALKNGKISGDQEIANFSDWAARSASPQYLDILFQKARDAKTPDNQRVTMFKALADASKLRGAKPTKDLPTINEFLKSKNNAIFEQAAILAGQWKITDARDGLEKAFVGADKTRANAALEGLRAFGGNETNTFLRDLAQDKKRPVSQRTQAISGMTKFNPAGAARLAAGILPTFDDPKAAGEVFATFLANNNATTHLTNALSGKDVTLPEPIALAGIQKASAAATRPDKLIQAIQKAGKLKPMKMSLTPKEMEAMMQQVAEKGNPQRGEAIYRRASLQCIVCHAIGGSGGIIGPDLVSIGSSAPVDYLIESLLEPSKKIKEGYHTTLVTLKNGDTFAGAVAREDNNEIVIRDAAGNENRISKKQIKNQQVSPISLMPPGLTLQLREDEFIDLVRFLSELGKEGGFKTTATPYVRAWEVLQPHERTRDDIGHYGNKIFAENDPTYQWSKLYTQVDGKLPVVETPEVVGRGKNRYAVARYQIEARTNTEIKLHIEGKTNDLDLFIDETEVSLPEGKSSADVTIPVKAGRHRITLVGLKGWGLDTLRVEIKDAGDTVVQ
ncbi:MAG: c-type cytochrome [Verrucomicrobiales bacterium]|nr:c-type cytochrome [Verrucomicrobiales bacterium]